MILSAFLSKVKRNPLIAIAIAVTIIVLLFLLSDASEEYQGLGMAPSASISENIKLGTDTTKFAAMISKVGYDKFLEKDGPFTVFAPSDQAYTKLSPDIITRLAKPEEEGTLRQLLLFHVVKGKIKESDFRDSMILTTLQGDTLTFTKVQGNWLINGYVYLETYDVESKNGVIHIINNYLLPESLSL